MNTVAFEGLTEIHQGPRYIIYRATEPDSGRTCALKVPVAANPTALYNEAGIGEGMTDHSALANSISWPGKPVLVRDFIEGVSLRRLLQSGKMPVGDCLRLAMLMAEDLERIHQKRVLHRDLSPDNLIVGPELRAVRWIDFEFSARAESLEFGFDALYHLESTLAYTAPEQTGRMNRKMDYRADYYALGAVLYEMLCGAPPFHTVDIMSLIHSHLALTPAKPEVLCPEIPPALSRIILKLLAKNAEDRYQSIPGLIADLGRCLTDWDNGCLLSDFEPGEYDHSGRLNISQKLYGRDQELRFLEAAYQQAGQGEKVIVLLGGFSGVGKSTLAQELFKPVTADMGLFLTGKFDAIQRSAPYFAWTQALDQLADQLFTESAEALHEWRDHILHHVNGLGSAIIGLCPRLVHVLGDQPLLDELPAKENQQRIQYALTAFFNALSTAKRPIVFFLDDWQWADDASLQLLEKVFTNQSRGRLLVIAAYRDNETDAVHPFTQTVNLLKGQTGPPGKPSPVQALELQPLTVAHTAQLLCDTLNSIPVRIQPLAEMVFSKTKGNAFATISLLESLHENKLLFFETKHMRWAWDMQAIGAQNITDNTINWLTTKVQRLPTDTVQVLKAAAAAGSSFYLSHLAAILGMRPAVVHRALEPALLVELIAPVEAHYKFLPEYYESMGIDVPFRFTHDRIQQAAYQLIEEGERQRVHFQTGQLLAPLVGSAQDGADLLFEVAQHFANSHALIEGSGKEVLASRLLREAGEKAYQSAAFDLAFNFLQKARVFSAFDLPTAIKIIESAYMTGQNAGDFVEEALSFCQNEVEKAQIREVNIRCLVNAARVHEATAATRIALRPLGVHIPDNTPQWKVIVGAVQTGMLLPASKINSIVELPLLSDPAKHAAMRILAAASPAFHMTDPNTYALVIFAMVRLSMRYGNCAESIQGFSSYGLVLAALAGKPEEGYKVGKQSLLLLDKLQAGFMEPVARFVDGGFIAHLKEPLVDTLPILQNGYAAALRSGSLDYATWCLFTQHWGRMLLGENMPELLVENAAAVRLCRQYNQLNQTSKLEPLHEAIRRLIEPEERINDWNTPRFDENGVRNASDSSTVSLFYVAKGYVLCLLEAYEPAVEAFDIVRKDTKGLFGSTALVTLTIFESVALQHTADFLKNKASQKRVQQNLIILRAADKRNPVGFRFAVPWIEGKAAALKDERNALSLFENAIRLAEEAGFLIPAAGIRRDLGAAMQQFGLPAWEQEIRRSADAFARMGMQAVELAVRERYLPKAPPSLSSEGAKVDVDTITLIKSAQVLAGEIKIDRLSEKLMRYALENAGAQKGWLILRRENAWVVEVGMEAGDEQGQFLRMPLAGSGLLAETVVNYTTQTGEPLVLDYAHLQAPFNADPFVRQYRSRSVLCIPFAHHGKIAGLLYLSNDLVEGAFTADRVALLSLMGGQMGVSIENALLYEQMETLVSRRTQQLHDEKQKSDALLRNILPEEIAEELKNEGLAKARYYEGVSVLFADIKDFTLLAERLHATELVQELDYCFRAFDAILSRHRVEKIKTIGDAYFCAAGLPAPYEDHAVELVHAALAMQAWMHEEKIRRQKNGQSWFELRIGIHSGPVIAGVVGASKFAYDIWGDTVNVAARMEQNSEPGKINISEHTYAMVKGHFSCAFRGAVEVKNKGSLNMYFVDSVL